MVSLLRSLLAQRQASQHLSTIIIKIIFHLCAQVNGFRYFQRVKLCIHVQCCDLVTLLYSNQGKRASIWNRFIYRFHSQSAAQILLVLYWFHCLKVIHWKANCPFGLVRHIGRWYHCIRCDNQSQEISSQYPLRKHSSHLPQTNSVLLVPLL